MKQGTELKSLFTGQGRKVVIRTVSLADLDALLDYVNGIIREDTLVMVSGKDLTRKEEKKYLRDAVEKLEAGKKIQLVAIVDGVLAGSCEVRMFDRRKAPVGQIGISLAKKYRSDGIGRACMELLIEQARKSGLQ